MAQEEKPEAESIPGGEVLTPEEIERRIGEELRGTELWQAVAKSAGVPVEEISAVVNIIVRRVKIDEDGKIRKVVVGCNFSGWCDDYLVSGLRDAADEIERENSGLPPECQPEARS